MVLLTDSELTLTTLNACMQANIYFNMCVFNEDHHHNDYFSACEENERKKGENAYLVVTSFHVK